MGGCDRRRAHGAGHVDDAAIWEAGNGGYRHAVTGIHLDQRCAEIDGLSVSFEPMHGPERRPSDTLAELPDNGWVCLTSVLALDVVDGLEQGGCVGRYCGQGHTAESRARRPGLPPNDGKRGGAGVKCYRLQRDI